MGDRRGISEKAPEYLEKVQRIMTEMSQVVENKGLQPPLFHVFSETNAPCPSRETGIFDEFPSWPVVLDQVRNKKRYRASESSVTKFSLLHAGAGASGLGVIKCATPSGVYASTHPV